MRVLPIIGAVLLAAGQTSAFPFMNINHLSSRGDNWAVLVAGSDGWYNYRHQADIAHAYHLLTANGMPADHIVLMMVDDVANSANNPRPGVLINQPGGPNVYKGIKIDYSGADVTPEVFRKVLLGEATHRGSNKTLGSGPNDNVFVNFVDHGGTGMIAFPRGAIMTSTELVDTLKAMHRKNMYDKLVFFLEACEAGSMFENILPKDINVYAHTAASATQPSYATYYDSMYHTFLGDAYSVAWMEDADQHFLKPNPLPETLVDQFWKIYQRIEAQSQPQQYGDLSLGRHSTIDDFLAYKKSGLAVPDSVSDTNVSMPVGGSFDVLVSSRDVKVYVLTKALQENIADQDTLLAQLEKEYRLNQEARDRFLYLAVSVGGSEAKAYLDTAVQTITDHVCLSTALRAFGAQCHMLDEHHIPYTHVLAALCNHGHTALAISESLGGNPLCGN